MYDASRRFVQYLGALMAEAGLTGWPALCAESGVSEATVSRWKSGAIAKPSDEHIRKLSSVLGAPIRDLLVVSGRFAANELAPEIDVVERILTSKKLTKTEKLDLMARWNAHERARIKTLTTSELDAFHRTQVSRREFHRWVLKVA